jgi:hypothetical protein
MRSFEANGHGPLSSRDLKLSGVPLPWPLSAGGHGSGLLTCTDSTDASRRPEPPTANTGRNRGQVGPERRTRSVRAPEAAQQHYFSQRRWPLALGVFGQVLPGQLMHRCGGKVSDREGEVLLEPDDYQPGLVKHWV